VGARPKKQKTAKQIALFPSSTTNTFRRYVSTLQNKNKTQNCFFFLKPPSHPSKIWDHLSSQKKYKTMSPLLLDFRKKYTHFGRKHIIQITKNDFFKKNLQENSPP